MSAVGVVDALQSVSQHAEGSQVNVVTRAGSWLDSLSNETHNRQDMEVANLSLFVEENQPQAVSKEKVTDSNVAGESDDNVVGVSDESEGPVDLGCPLPVDISEASVLKGRINDDESLTSCRELESKGMNGSK